MAEKILPALWSLVPIAILPVFTPILESSHGIRLDCIRASSAALCFRPLVPMQSPKQRASPNRRRYYRIEAQQPTAPAPSSGDHHKRCGKRCTLGVIGSAGAYLCSPSSLSGTPPPDAIAFLGQCAASKRPCSMRQVCHRANGTVWTHGRRMRRARAHGGIRNAGTPSFLRPGQGSSNTDGAQ